MENQPLIENLNYLKDTKEKIKDALLEKGASIDDSTPFRDYEDIIKNLDTDNAQPYKGVNPTTSSQTIEPDEGYTSMKLVNVAAVTSSIDANIIPANIKKGVSILGVQGEMDNSRPFNGQVPFNSVISASPYSNTEIKVSVDICDYNNIDGTRIYYKKNEIPDSTNNGYIDILKNTKTGIISNLEKNSFYGIRAEAFKDIFYTNENNLGSKIMCRTNFEHDNYSNITKPTDDFIVQDNPGLLVYSKYTNTYYGLFPDKDNRKKQYFYKLLDNLQWELIDAFTQSDIYNNYYWTILSCRFGIIIAYNLISSNYSGQPGNSYLRLYNENTGEITKKDSSYQGNLIFSIDFPNNDDTWVTFIKGYYSYSMDNCTYGYTKKLSADLSLTDIGLPCAMGFLKYFNNKMYVLSYKEDSVGSGSATYGEGFYCKEEDDSTFTKISDGCSMGSTMGDMYDLGAGAYVVHRKSTATYDSNKNKIRLFSYNDQPLGNWSQKICYGKVYRDKYDNIYFINYTGNSPYTWKLEKLDNSNYSVSTTIYTVTPSGDGWRDQGITLKKYKDEVFFNERRTNKIYKMDENGNPVLIENEADFKNFDYYTYSSGYVYNSSGIHCLSNNILIYIGGNVSIYDESQNKFIKINNTSNYIQEGYNVYFNYIDDMIIISTYNSQYKGIWMLRNGVLSKIYNDGYYFNKIKKLDNSKYLLQTRSNTNNLILNKDTLEISVADSIGYDLSGLSLIPPTFDLSYNKKQLYTKDILIDLPYTYNYYSPYNTGFTFGDAYSNRFIEISKGIEGVSSGAIYDSTNRDDIYLLGLDENE